MQRFVVLSLAVVVLAWAAPAAAQRIEITPFAGYQFGGELDEIGDETSRRDLEQSPSWGLIFDVDVADDLQVEIYYSSQGTQLDRGTEPAPHVDVDMLQIGLIREFDRGNAINPYLGLTGGATRFEIGSDDDTRFSGGLTLGLKMLVSDHLGFRFDGRVFGTSTGSGAFSCSDEPCIGYPDTSIVWQYAVNAGVIIHFGF